MSETDRDVVSGTLCTPIPTSPPIAPPRLTRPYAVPTDGPQPRAGRHRALREAGEGCPQPDEHQEPEKEEEEQRWEGGGCGRGRWGDAGGLSQCQPPSLHPSSSATRGQLQGLFPEGEICPEPPGRSHPAGHDPTALGHLHWGYGGCGAGGGPHGAMLCDFSLRRGSPTSSYRTRTLPSCCTSSSTPCPS